MATNTNDPKKTSTARANDAATRISTKLSGPLAPLEKALDGVLGEKAPYKIPKNGRETLVKIAPWLSLASGIFGLISALGLWRLGHQANEVIDNLNSFSVAIGAPVQKTPGLGLTFWVSIVLLVIFSALALLAFPGLKARKKTGWNLMFFSALANIVYGIVSIFYDGAGFGSFLGTAIGTVLGLYLLFQVRSYYKS